MPQPAGEPLLTTIPNLLYHRYSYHCMDRRPATPFSDEEPHDRQDTPTGYRSDEDDVRSSWSRTSSRSSVDSMLIEHISGSDSSSNPSLRGPQPSASNLESGANRSPARGWMSKLGRGVGRSAAKRKATKLLDELIQANNTTDGQATARQRRYKAATGLVEIIKNKPDGEEIVARRFVKSASRQDQGTQALLRLSDDELDLFGSRAVSPVPEPLAFTKLLTVVVKHTNESQFFRRTISTALRDGKEGVAAILYLATTETRNFFLDTDDRILASFCNRIVKKEAPSCLKWLCGAKLFCIFVRESDKFLYTQLTTATARSVCKELIQAFTETLDPSASEASRKDPVTGDTALLYTIAVCFDAVIQDFHQSCFPTLESINTFIDCLISLIPSGYGTSQSLNIKSAFALSTLRSLVQNHVIVTAISGDTLFKLGVMFLDMTLYRPALEIREAGTHEKVWGIICA
ncbi:hypothetical protein FRC04_009639 [Tulasnella sp. 424]|nr:hypothetical protein FRC04_009639 [Tulasnella sp. 424]KAG8975939.1 hypothetical protein FRC05_004870 [Tulasnella sp. 425]